MCRGDRQGAAGIQSLTGGSQAGTGAPGLPGSVVGPALPLGAGKPREQPGLDVPMATLSC